MLNINWRLLAQQKAALVDLRASLDVQLYAPHEHKRYDKALSGIIHLLDGLEDEHEKEKSLR